MVFTGGDSLYSVAVTGTAIYMGGHQRWENNPFCADCLGPGGVPRPGLTALDPVNGMAFSWNPRRARGLGAQSLLATDDGLWVGSDTDKIGNEYHAKIALLPLDGGWAPPAANPGTLPGEFTTIQQDGSMVARSFDGATFEPATPRTSVNWSNARGAFMLSGKLYTPWSTGSGNGAFYRQGLNGNFVGPQHAIDLLRLDTKNLAPKNMTGSFYWNGRWYYTLSGDTRLYYRGFEPESDIIGADVFVASGSGDGYNWSGVRGLTMANGKMYFGGPTGNLSVINFDLTTGKPTGLPTVISGPGIDGNDWNSRALFVRSDA